MATHTDPIPVWTYPNAWRYGQYKGSLPYEHPDAQELWQLSSQSYSESDLRDTKWRYRKDAVKLKAFAVLRRVSKYVGGFWTFWGVLLAHILFCVFLSTQISRGVYFIWASLLALRRHYTFGTFDLCCVNSVAHLYLFSVMHVGEYPTLLFDFTGSYTLYALVLLAKYVALTEAIFETVNGVWYFTERSFGTEGNESSEAKFEFLRKQKKRAVLELLFIEHYLTFAKEVSELEAKIPKDVIPKILEFSPDYSCSRTAMPYLKRHMNVLAHYRHGYLNRNQARRLLEESLKDEKNVFVGRPVVSHYIQYRNVHSRSEN